jgi:hypothetical protein
MPARYSGFPSFAEWDRCAPNLEHWERYVASLNEIEMTSYILQRVRLIIKEAASARRRGAKENGEKIAGLSLFRAMCEAAVPEIKVTASRSFEAQLLTYNHVMDFAVKKRKMSESWICRLHLLLSGAPKKTEALKTDRIKEALRQSGPYKRVNNRMVRRKGRNLPGAPVSRTSAEMRKFCRELCSKTFLDAHPVLQASYAHYALVLIHPFADGNGRVARTLAFTFMYRANLIPTLVLNRNRGEYLSALRSADFGDFQPFINLVNESAVESVRLIKRSIVSAMQQG